MSRASRTILGLVTVATACAGLAACSSSDSGPVDGARSIQVAGLATNAVVREPAGARPKGTVVFLHGAAYDSKIWARRGILDAVTKAGWQAVAVDLPGHGDTEHGPGVDASADDRATFVDSLVELYGGPESVVLVSPSMSGAYSLPYLRLHADAKLAGFVPIAPSGAETYDRPATAATVPTLSVFGSEDGKLDEKRPAIEAAFPGTRTEVIDGGSHAAYDDHAKEFIALLKDFLAGLDPAQP